MENALRNLNDPTDEDMAGIEALYNSLFSISFCKANQTSIESDHPPAENDEIPNQKLLDMVIQKCFKKIRADRTIKEHYIKELEEARQLLTELQEENMNLKEAQKDSFTKIEQLETYIDQTEEINNDLQKQIEQLEILNQEHILSKEKKKLLAKSHSLHFERKDGDLLNKNRLEVENCKMEICTLRETMDLQEQIIMKLENEIEEHQTIGSQYAQLKTCINKMLSFEDLDEENVDPQLLGIVEKIKSFKEQLSLQIFGSKDDLNSKNMSRRSLLIEQSLLDDSEDEQSNKNIRATRNSLSFNELKASPFRRQKSLAEDLISSKRSEFMKETSPQSVYRVIKPRTIHMIKQDAKIRDFTREYQEQGRYSKNTEGTLSTFDGIDRDGCSPEFQSPAGPLEPEEVFQCVEILDQDQEDEQVQINDNEREIVDWFEGDAFKSDLCIVRKLKSSKSSNSKKSNEKERNENKKINHVKKETENNNDLIKIEEQVIRFDKREEHILVANSSLNQIEYKVQDTGEIISSFQEIPQYSQEKHLQPKVDYAIVMKEYIKKERKNAAENTSLPFFKLLSLLIFGP